MNCCGDVGCVCVTQCVMRAGTQGCAVRAGAEGQGRARWVMESNCILCWSPCSYVTLPCMFILPLPSPPHHSPVTSHPSPTPHPSPLTPHSSPLTPHPSPLTPHPSPLTPHCFVKNKSTSYLYTLHMNHTTITTMAKVIDRY